MSGMPASAARSTNPRVARATLKFSMDWITRPVFGLLLGGITIAAVYEGGVIFALLIAAVVIAAAREWHRMITPENHWGAVVVTGVTVLAAALVETFNPGSVLPWLFVGAGTVTNFILAMRRSGLAAWHAVGVLYLAVPTLALLLLRNGTGVWLLVALFASVWASDTGALIAGNLIGGRKLCPTLSPNKTWSGLLGGIASAAVVSVAIFAFLRRDLVVAALLGAGLSLAGHAGDLFESWAKRKFKIKNSGSLIPGHGGMLDRIDSTLFAAPALAFLVLVAGFNPLAGSLP